MKTTQLFIYMFLFSMIGWTACSYSSNRKILTKAQHLAEHFPDSAGRLLEEQLVPASLNDRDKATYWYILTFVHLMQGRSLVNDSLINYSVAYYRQQDNKHALFNACRFAAWQANWGDRNKKRQEHLWLEAQAVAEAEQNPDYLSDIYYQLSQFYWDEKEYQKAIAVCRKKEKLSPNDKAVAWYTIGLSYGRSGMPDSCRWYMSNAAELAYELKSKKAFHYMRNYADYLAGENPQEAFTYLQRIREVFPDETLDMTYASVYKLLGRMDSADHYLAKAELAGRTDLLSEATWQVYRKAISMMWKAERKERYNSGELAAYCDSVSSVTAHALQNEKELLTAQNKLIRDNFTIEAKRQHTLLLLFAVLFVGTVAGGIAFYYIRKRRDQLLEAEEKLDALQLLLREAIAGNTDQIDTTTRPDSAFFRKILLQQLGIIRLVATVPTQQNRELLQQMSRIANQDIPADALLVWSDLYPVIDAVYNLFYTRLIRYAAGRLSEKELQLCCLLCAGFSTKEISVVTQQSIRTIYQRKTNIRHALCMEEKDDIVAFVERAAV